MKRFIAAAALLGAAVLPATAGAVPPKNTSVPVGSNAACFVVASPALPATCNFVGAGSSDVGYIGGGSGTFEISHQRKVVTCDGAGKVNGFALVKDIDQSGSMVPPNAADQNSWSNGIVYTVTLTGVGWLAVGGQGTPAPAMVTGEPTVGAAPGYAGAQDGTGGKAVGDSC